MLVEYLDSIKNNKKFQVVEWGYSENSIPLTFNKFENWVKLKRNTPLKYLADHRFELRSDLKKFYPKYQSALGFLFSYESTHYELKEIFKNNESHLKLASFTLGFEGLDYHHVIKEHLNSIRIELQKIDSDLEVELSLDVHPVLERDLAYGMGLGFFGKNTMLIHPKLGSYFIIGSLLLNKKLNLSHKTVEANHCGQCTRCIDACPTKALDDLGMNTSRCISTFTIEQMGASVVMDPNMNLSSGYVFGCDICQDVCPFNNRRIRQNLIEKRELSLKSMQLLGFLTHGKIQDIILKIQNFSNKEYKNFFIGTSFFRSGKQGILKNYLKAQKDIN